MDKRDAKMLLCCFCMAGGLFLYLWHDGTFSPGQPVSTPPTAAAPTPPPVSVDEPEMVRLMDQGTRFRDRVAILQQLPADLDAADRALVRRLVMDRAEHPTIRNDALAVLENQDVKDPALAGRLIGMFEDDQESATWRDYTLQHLVPTFEYAADKQAVIALLNRVAAGEDHLAGTAMLSLEAIGQRHEEVAALLRSVVRLRNSKPVSDAPVAMTAIQLAREEGDRSVLPRCRVVAVNEELKARLRMSAIATLGQIGTAADRALLEQLAGHGDQRIRRAATANLAAMDRRFAGTAE